MDVATVANMSRTSTLDCQGSTPEDAATAAGFYREKLLNGFSRPEDKEPTDEQA